jgi:hypothetical protein
MILLGGYLCVTVEENTAERNAIPEKISPFDIKSSI